MFKQWWVIVFLGVSSVHAEQRYFCGAGAFGR